jgi:alcohol dehydrogenase
MADIDDFQMRKFVAPEFVFGIGSRLLAAQYARNFGVRKVLVVSDRGVEKAGWMGEVVENLREAGLELAVFLDLSSNPRAEEVMEGARIYAAERCNCIVAVGGGSPMDCAKGIGIVCSAPNTHILEYEGVDEVKNPVAPLICIPTTAGTSADVSQFAIITDTERKVKIAIISKAIVPDVALIDPAATLTMDPYLTACTAMDALCHGIESYVSLAHSPVTDLHALEGIRLVSENLLRVQREPDNLLYRSKLMLGSLETGLAFSNASLGAVHAMAHSVGGLLDFAHGEANSLLLEPVVAYNFAAAPERFRTVAGVMGIRTEGIADEAVRDELVRKLAIFRREAGIDSSFTSLGVTRRDVPDLARKALLDPCIVTNPRPLTQQEVEKLFEYGL